MKQNRVEFIVVLLGVLLLPAGRARAQALPTGSDLSGMTPLEASEVPAVGTFWILQGPTPGRPLPPLPWPSIELLELSVPLYHVGNSNFLFDDRDVDWGALWEQQQMETALRSLEYQYGLLENPPLPGDPGGGGGDDPPNPGPPVFSLGSGLALLPPVFVSGNSMVLGITNTSESGWLTNFYDLFYTTNLSAAVPPLNLTNWAWLARGLGTNFTLPTLDEPECYFRLGTMQDTDGDGLTDAYERLASHTDPTNGDVDGDGLPDGKELELGLSPFEQDSDSDGVIDQDFQVALTFPRSTGTVP